MKFEHFIMVLLLPAGLLLVAGGAAFQHFQHWALADVQASSPRESSFELVEQTVYASDTLSSPEVLLTPLPALNAFSKVLEQPIKAVSEVGISSSSEQSGFLSLDKAKNITQPGLVEVLTENSTGVVVANLTEASTEKPPSLFASFKLEANQLAFWFPKTLASEQNIKRGIARILLSGQPFNELDILTLAPLEMRERPFFYRRVFDDKGRAIRYPFDAFKYIDYLLSHDTYTTKTEQGITVTIPLVASNIAAPAQFYEPWVMQFSADFNVSPALVFAVMETESHFNPTAVSRSNALGLMQIKAQSAGRDVYKLVDFRMDAPSPDELFDPKTNIRIGTAYLSLLKYDYFGLIRNEEVREMIAISSYNGGLSTVWRLFGDTPEAAIAQINQMNPRLVYRKLRYDHPSDETRRYLDKVLQAKQRYQALLGDDARLLASR
ncbi:DUF3393 domain-containing protein [Thiomicrospira microaerophila]|uniref:murein transglycosylase domain-containing protein n=1 Tax=Thiomicrospira microaerophila TaxID=406020 RepID=UPI00200C2A8B|nr:murein transglycosylase domain-containing protein [Thiomicrospira microaerophila]UQB42701.1 DUF3393 domain-containing protein [Thiomicrospira microaerophila]